VKRLIEQKDALYGGPEHWYSQPLAFIRSLPGIDLAPPTKIQQLSLPELFSATVRFTSILAAIR
jgi:hypothetical protein